MVTIAVMASGVTSASFAATRVGGDYFTGLFGIENPPMKLIAVAVILLVAAVNYRGVGESIRINIAITAVAATAFYAFIGLEDSVNMAEEVRDPIRSFPPALLTGIVGASIIYLLVGFTAAMTVPLDTLTESSGPLLEIVKEGVPGLNADTVFSAVAMIAVSNTMLINMLMASRLLYGMANQGVLPAPFGLVSPRKTPWFGIVFTTVLSILLILTTKDLEGLSDTTVLLLTSVFLLVNIAVLVLRRDRVGHQHVTAPRFLPPRTTTGAEPGR